MAAEIPVVMPDGEQVHATFPVDAEAWSVEDGQRFFADLWWKAFRYQLPPGRRLSTLMSVERGPGGIVVAVHVYRWFPWWRISVAKRTLTVGPFNWFLWWRINVNRPMTVGPFNPSVEGLDGVCSLATRLTVERKDVPSH